MTDPYGGNGEQDGNAIVDPAPASGQSAAGAAERVQRALDALDEIREVAPADQVAAFAEAQRSLAAALSDIGNE